MIIHRSQTTFLVILIIKVDQSFTITKKKLAKEISLINIFNWKVHLIFI